MRSVTPNRTSRLDMDRHFDSNLHKFFTEVSLRAVTAEWQLIFEDAANGIFPPGVHHSNGILIYTEPVLVNGKPKTYKLVVPNDPDKAYKKCVNFLQKRGVCSVADSNTARKPNAGWVAVKKDEHKYFFLHRYVLSLTEQYNLNQEEVDQLWHKLASSVLTRSLINGDIKFSRGQIEQINTLQWLPQHRQFSIG